MALPSPALSIPEMRDRVGHFSMIIFVIKWVTFILSFIEVAALRTRKGSIQLGEALAGHAQGGEADFATVATISIARLSSYLQDYIVGYCTALS